MLLRVDQVRPLGVVFGLEDGRFGGCHGVGSLGSLGQSVEVNSNTFYSWLLTRRSSSTSRTASRPSLWTTRDPQRALRSAADRAPGRAAGGQGGRRRSRRGARLLPREGVLGGRQPGRLRRGCADRPQVPRHRALPPGLHRARRARQAVDRRRVRPCPRRLARDRPRLRPHHRQGHRRLRHARDQRRPLPVHDHGADLPERPAQEDDGDAPSGRSADRRRGARGRDRQQGRPGRGVRRRGRRVGAEARVEVAAGDEARQGRDVAPARHAADRRARLPARPAHDRASDRGRDRGRHGVLRKARARMEGKT